MRIVSKGLDWNPIKALQNILGVHQGVVSLNYEFAFGEPITKLANIDPKTVFDGWEITMSHLFAMYAMQVVDVFGGDEHEDEIGANEFDCWNRNITIAENQILETSVVPFLNDTGDQIVEAFECPKHDCGFAVSAELDRFMRLKGVKVGELEPITPQKFFQTEILQELCARQSAPVFDTLAFKTSSTYHPSQTLPCIVSHLFVTQKETTNLLETQFKMQLTECFFETNCIFINASTCVLIIQIDMILDDRFIPTLSWHALKVNRLGLIFELPEISDHEMRKDSFTPPIESALARM